jgi:hypothetical protein
LQPKLIERAGPTGLILTTTVANLHPENETRLLSLTVRDDPLQTAGVLRSLAQRARGAENDLPDVTPWQALQTWLELAGCREVTIPYADEIALLADSRAVRLRRDFGAVLNLVRAHAILHQGTHSRDSQGRIIATVDDYAVVYDLVIDIIAQGVQATVDARIRDAVGAVKELDTPVDPGIQVIAIAKALGLDKSAALRRVRVAIEDGYLVNLEERKGRPARITLGDPLPEERPVLPRPDAFAEQREGGVVLSPPSTAQPCNRSTPAIGEGGVVLSPPSTLQPCNRSTPATGDDRAGLPPTPPVPLASPTAGPAAAQGAFGWRPAEIPPTDDSPQATLETWQQSILDEFDL